MEVKQIKENPNNPRQISTGDLEKLVQSIQEFPEMMEKRPIVLVTDTDGKAYPIGGNMRLRAIKKIGMKTIPETWYTMADDWSEEKRQEFVIKDNNSSGTWDFQMLRAGWSVEDLEKWGIIFEEKETKDSFDKTFDSITNHNAKYPIIPQFDEKHELFVIVADSEIDSNWLREKLNMQKMESYKHKGTYYKSNITSVKNLKDVL